MLQHPLEILLNQIIAERSDSDDDSERSDNNSSKKLVVEQWLASSSQMTQVEESKVTWDESPVVKRHSDHSVPRPTLLSNFPSLNIPNLRLVFPFFYCNSNSL